VVVASRRAILTTMRIAVAADERVGIAGALIEALVARGHEVSAHGALAPPTRDRAPTPPVSGQAPGAGDGDGVGSPEREPAREDGEGWAWAAEAAARDVAMGDVEQAVVCCWTGTGASIAANKVAGVRAALCADAATAAGARRWNDANVLVLSLRATSEAELQEILDAWFAGAASDELADRMNVAHLSEIELRESRLGPPGLDK
jgi:ribose 5-phosphate isomerase B